LSPQAKAAFAVAVTLPVPALPPANEPAAEEVMFASIAYPRAIEPRFEAVIAVEANADSARPTAKLPEPEDNTLAGEAISDWTLPTVKEAAPVESTTPPPLLKPTVRLPLFEPVGVLAKMPDVLPITSPPCKVDVALALEENEPAETRPDAVREPVKFAAELILWPLMRPDVTVPRFEFVLKRLVVLAVVAKKFVVVAFVVVERSAKSPPITSNVVFGVEVAVSPNTSEVAEFAYTTSPFVDVANLSELAGEVMVLQPNVPPFQITAFAVPLQVVRPAPVNFVVEKLVEVAFVVVERVLIRSVNVLRPVNALLSARSVEEAAVVILLQPNLPEPL
jgi:hypothetical protein